MTRALCESCPVCLWQVPQRKNQTGYFDLDTSLVGCKGLPWASGKRYAPSHLGSLSVELVTRLQLTMFSRTRPGRSQIYCSLDDSLRSQIILLYRCLPHQLLIIAPSGTCLFYALSCSTSTATVFKCQRGIFWCLWELFVQVELSP